MNTRAHTAPPVVTASAEPEPPAYTYRAAAHALGLAVQTLYRRVSEGTFPPPTETLVGLRFSADLIRSIAAGNWPPPQQPAPPTPNPPRKRGRPRIADQRRGGRQ